APMKSVSGGKFAMYAGDVNQDGTIDLFDLLDTENDASNFVGGYNATDVNGDSVSDLFDLLLIENNTTLFIFVAHP
ncbi:MAG: Dockerin type domain, partial [Bacteroidota bacterium]